MWVDDDVAEPTDDVVEWLGVNPQVLVGAPDLFTGLTQEHLDAIEAWL